VPIEFLGMGATNDGSETNRRSNGSFDHYLALDTGGRALIASLDGLVVPKVVYAVSADFVDGEPRAELLDALRAAIDQAEDVAKAIG
jgi:hypothetical protein